MRTNSVENRNCTTNIQIVFNERRRKIQQVLALIDLINTILCFPYHQINEKETEKIKINN